MAKKHHGHHHTGKIHHGHHLDGTGKKDPHASEGYHSMNSEHDMPHGMTHSGDGSGGEEGGEGMADNCEYT